jgi:TPR repeat protein
MGKASRPFLGAVFIAFAVAGASSAGPYEDAVAAHERADYATATRLWRPLAERGDPAAQLMLGSMFHDGLAWISTERN